MDWTIILIIVGVLLSLIVLGFVIFRINAKSQPIAGTNSQGVDTQARYPWEFWLVVVMLVALLSLILAVLVPDIQSINSLLIKPKEGNPPTITVEVADLLAYNKMQLDSRKDILAIIITAFGAWVGAGAAYFFGRENLRVAADSLLAMRDLSPKERLRRTSIKQIPPTPIDWTIKRTDKINDVKAALILKPERWFVPVVKDDGTLDTVINEEAVWRYLIDKLPPVDATDEDKKKYAESTVEDLLKYIDETEALNRFNQIHAVVSMETNVGAANDLMDSRHVFLAIVTSEGKPTHFFTTSEVRKLLLQE